MARHVMVMLSFLIYAETLSVCPRVYYVQANSIYKLKRDIYKDCRKSTGNKLG